MKQTAVAGTILTVGQVYAMNEMVFTRKEAEAQISSTHERFLRVDDDMGEIKSFVREMRTELSKQRMEDAKTNENVAILMHELKKKSDAEEERVEKERRESEGFSF